MLNDLPPRYEPQKRLGAGGGGEVWAVRDRVTGEMLALKVLASDAGERGDRWRSCARRWR